MVTESVMPAPQAPAEALPGTDAVVVGSGPNGLAAAITLAKAGLAVTVLEAADEPGGGTRSAELTLPGFVHDVCSTIHVFGRTSPFFAEHGAALAAHGLRWVRPPAALGHPLDDGSAVMLRGDVEETAAGLGEDRDAYRRLFGWLVDDADTLLPDLLAPFHVPLSPLRAVRMARFGVVALQPASRVARRFGGDAARALFAGIAAHSILRLTEPVSAAAALVLGAAAHVDGWPFPEGGAGRLPAALVAELAAHGGRVETGRRVTRLDDLPDHRLALFDTSPTGLASIAGERLPDGYRRRLERYRHGPGVFKLDLAIDGPIPWRSPELLEAATVHVGGTLEEIARSEADVAAGRVPDRPFVLLVQASLFDPGRAPAGRHTVWAYCHVPNGSREDAGDRILAQIERFAPGFRDRVLGSRATGPAEIEAYNPNDIGGDIAGGRFDLGQLFTRPSLRILDPYATPDPAIFLCSAATPPGGGVHGMCGVHAARSALDRLS
ncbi:MAG TPA: NAD(P)/FAD-dependent oxidoreductase [Candidatus Limnocylindrales bacterium]|nr:NAD(P)/FAD-dependent oxidoreductase [Candidatus Limnocylindrales bacterium]